MKEKKRYWKIFLFVLLFVIMLLPSGMFFPESEMPYLPAAAAIGMVIWFYAVYWLLAMFLHPVFGWILLALAVSPLLWWLYGPKRRKG